MKRALVSCLLAVTTVAYAGPPHTVLVLKAEGTADEASRTAIGSEVLRLAKQLDGKVDAGDITLSDAAAAAGCTISDPTCKDEILATFAVDELVATTVTANGTNVNVTVRRMTTGVPPAAAQTSLDYGNPPSAIDRGIGSLFGIEAAPVQEPPAPPVVPVPAQPEAPTPPAPEPVAEQPAPPVDMQPPAPVPGPVDSGPPSRRWQKIGIGVGAGMVLLGAIMWTQASAKQDEIDNAPHDTPADFVHLRQLEDDADGLAGGGNLFVIAGVALAGVSAYYYWKKGRAHHATTTAARITPTVFAHGGGVVLTFGGVP
jgi:hypothetical protein